jgi:hypothetical protein
MQASEASPQLCAPWNQFWVHPMRQPDSNTPSMYESGIQHPPHLPSSPTPTTCGDAPSPSDSHISSECSSMPLQLYDLQKLEAEVGPLFEGLSGNAPALQVLTELRSEIHNFAWIDEDRAGDLVLSHGSFFYCPSPTCPKHLDGWDRLDRARDHVWADHLGRYYLCLWVGWYVHPSHDLYYPADNGSEVGALSSSIASAAITSRTSTKTTVKSLSALPGTLPFPC